MGRLENRDFENAARLAAAQCDQARAELMKVKFEAQRRRSLFKQKLVSNEELDTYETAERVAEAQARNSEATHGCARAKLADTEIGPLDDPAGSCSVSRHWFLMVTN